MKYNKLPTIVENRTILSKVPKPEEGTYLDALQRYTIIFPQIISELVNISDIHTRYWSGDLDEDGVDTYIYLRDAVREKVRELCWGFSDEIFLELKNTITENGLSDHIFESLIAPTLWK